MSSTSSVVVSVLKENAGLCQDGLEREAQHDSGNFKPLDDQKAIEAANETLDELTGEKQA